MDILKIDDDNLKEEATRQIVDLGCSIENVARSTGICEMTLYRWTQEHIRKSSVENK